ncbi:hypothetical protein MGSAQ_001346 [marine sediment metagenome]|uniref:Uncharacterized protein n=1 Tax=marine sediment metagenome TaxID=412755 RepID=A0A1B6NWN7_9ZZZZ
MKYHSLALQSDNIKMDLLLSRMMQRHARESLSHNQE